MSSSGAYLFDPSLADFCDEAFERAGISPKIINGDHIMSFRRSVNFMFSMLASKGVRQWKFTQITHTVAVDETNFDLTTGVIDVTAVVLRRSSVDTEMYPISRDDYLILANKTLTGRPDRYFVDKKRDTPGDSVPPVMYYWQAGENATDQIIVNAWLRPEDAGSAQNTMDIPYPWYDWAAEEMAARMAQKFKPERRAELMATAKLKLDDADDTDTESAPLSLSVSYGHRYGRR